MSSTRTTRHFRTAVPLLMAALAVALPACSATQSGGNAATPDASGPPTTQLGAKSGPDDATTPTDGGQLEFGIEAEPEGLDPIRYAFSSSANFVASAVFDPLMTLDANANPVPYLAKSVDGSADNKTWTITLPTGITFHDGTPLTAQVVADDMKAYQTSAITGAAMKIVSTIEATDDTHVVVKLTDPMVSWPATLTTQQGYIFAPAMATDTTLVDEPVGTGPFIITGHTKDQIWSFKKNPNYWRQGLPHLDGIDFKPIPDNAARLEGLEKGDLDMINVRSPQEAIQLRSSTNFKRVENASGEEEFIVLNTQQPPFDNPIARQAIVAAIDTAQWQKEIGLDVEQATNSVFAPGQLGYLADNGYPKPDAAKAKALVQQYEKESGQSFNITYYTQADVNVQAETQMFQKMLEDAGITVTVQALPQINLIAQIATGSYQIARFRLFGSANPDVDANTFWGSSAIQPAPAVSLNFPHYADPKIDAAIKTAFASTDPTVRDEAYQTINKQFASNLPYIWLGRAVWNLAASPRVNGIYAATNGTIETLGPKTWLADLWIGK
jgi:peptide/nickel transport system substrate-binding protein